MTTPPPHAWSTLSPAEVRQVGLALVQERIGTHGWNAELIDARTKRWRRAVASAGSRSTCEPCAG